MTVDAQSGVYLAEDDVGAEQDVWDVFTVRASLVEEEGGLVVVDRGAVMGGVTMVALPGALQGMPSAVFPQVVEHTARILQLIESAAGDIEAADRRAQQLPGGMAQVATELQAISWFLAQLKTKLEEGTIDKEEL